MKRSFLLFVVLLFSFTAVADPTIASLEPGSGPESGGTEVTITGNDLLPHIVCIIPCPATVTFGDVTVEVKSETETRLVVVTPPHAPGTVDVRVNVSGEEPVRMPGAFAYVSDAEAGYEQVLLPIYLDGVVPGANGTQWRTDLWIRNNSPQNIALAPWTCPEGEACLPVFPLTYTLLPGLSIHNIPADPTPGGNPGRLLYVSRELTSDVSFGLRFADISRASSNGGTDMPVIREGEFLTERSQLFNVPLDGDFRVLLRVYDAAQTRALFRVAVYAQTTDDEQPLHTAVLQAATAETGDFRTEPAYAQFDVTELLHLDHQAWPEAVRIEITPLTPGSRYWAFASVTNNETQLVTLMTPQ
ncbi:MAG TPA: IPT/TIG domain-containing protein [Thermoanaerobaculia bacterium]|nr:IPT/TIG domain-containing protein [Thermoanaerobaculia bacterium]